MSDKVKKEVKNEDHGLTELVFILDKSGSMEGTEEDTIGGFNSMLKKQQAIPGDCNVTTVLFNDNYELLHDRLNIRGVAQLTNKDYEVGGTTALYDAIGETIKKIASVQKTAMGKFRPKNVLFVIITDGYENASREYRAGKIRELITKQKKAGWEFVFLGADIDAITAAREIGIDDDKTANFLKDKKGTRTNFSAMSEMAKSVRRSEKLCSACLAPITADYENRVARRKKK